MDFEKLAINDRKIIVGIDFGTTYSGIAWAETQRPDRRMTNTAWPISRATREGESSDKVPTKLRYAEDGIQWGFAIPTTAPQDEVIEWFKLDLDPSLSGVDKTNVKNDGKEDGESSSSSKTSIGRDAEKLVTDYLSALVDHLLYMLREKLGEQIVKGTPLEFVVTVPAIWSELAKDKTRKACQRATEKINIRSPIHLISEPEAAAIYALHGLDPHGLQVNDTIVVVDAGGGTVDLISYTIMELKPVLQVQEASPGSGGLCGSTFLNRRFAHFLKSKLGNEEGFDDEVLAEAMEVFEKKIKRQFTLGAPPSEAYTIPAGGLANNKALGISRGRYALKASDLESIFEPVVYEIIKLVKDQIDKNRVPVKAVLLVGGFGASNYLKERLRAAVSAPTQILQPPNAWQAVVQGAVMKGLANSAPDRLTTVKVKNRRARKHYGLRLGTIYDRKIHAHMSNEKYWDGKDGVYRVRAMTWFIKRGDQVSENNPFFESYIKRSLIADGRIRKVRSTIYCDQVSDQAPIELNGNVKELAHLEADLSHIPEKHLNRSYGKDGKLYYLLDFHIEAVYLSASTTYTLIYNNTRYDTVTCEYV